MKADSARPRAWRIDNDIGALRDAEDVARWVMAFYGDPLTAPAGVAHVTSVWVAEDGSLVTLKIDEHAPESEHDFFVLNLARARADAIVITGKILRDEPDVRHDIQGAGSSAEALADWRRQALGKNEPPISVVLSSGRELDLDHPLFGGATRAMVYTSPKGRERLAEAARQRGIELVSDTEPSLRRAIDHLRRQEGAGTISIECGPTTSAELYLSPLAVDELLLSTYEDELAERSRGSVLLDRSELLERMVRSRRPTRVRSASGRWRFERYVRSMRDEIGS